MSEKTRIFKRLPKDAGVTFEGFEDVRIKEREVVKEQLEDFIEYCKTARGTAFRVILGEWGEGKTDAYRRYIYPKLEAENNLAFFVSASSLSNSFDLPDVQNLLETTSLSAVRFLVALFCSIRQEQKEKLIPSLRRYDDAEIYLDKAFDNLIGRKKSRRIVVFIDEFEGLLHYAEKLKQIISGIKQTINGQYSNIDEGGKYEGCLHLIVAATPDAFYRLQVSEETSLIFGGLSRRAGVIDLPQIRKEEGMRFLFALLNYSYENDLPKPLPFKTSGIFNAIYRITQSNPGIMVSLFTRLMNSAKADKHHVKIIDYEHFLEFLEKQQVFVYGGASPCLERETFLRMLKTIEDQKTTDLGKKCGALLKLLTGELRSFSTFELCTRMGWYEKDVKRYINIINTDLKNRENIERCVLKLATLKKGKSLADVKEAFKEYITMEREKKWIKVDNYSESIDDFEDRITYFDIEEGKIVAKIYLPSDNYSVSSFFEGVDPDTAVELANVVCRRLCAEENYYLTSDEFLSQVYPTPIPRELEFIRNRDIRWKLWRELRKNLADQYRKYMPLAFVDILETSQLFNISPIKKLALNASLNEATIDKLSINVLFYAINGDAKSTDIDEISKWIKQTRPPIHCCVVLYTGDITQEAQDKIVNKEMGMEGENVLLDIKIHPTLARRLICMYRVRNEYPQDVDTSLLESVVQKIVTQDIDFEGKMKSWLSTQEERGVAIKDLEVDATSNLREFAGSLKFYINFIERKATPDEIFKKNREELLDKFIRYGSKIGLIPDIELPKFRSLTKDLMINRFLQKEDKRYSVQLHPVEKRILKILEKEKKLSEKELEDFLIFRSTRFLKDVFLPILEYKGLVRKEANYYLLNDTKTLWEDVELKHRKLRRRVEAWKELLDYGYVFLCKKREHRFITLKEFVTYIDTLHQETKDRLYEVDKAKILQKLSLLGSLLDHFTQNFLPVFSAAVERAKRIFVETDGAYSKFKDQLEDIKEGCIKWLKLEFEVENVEEYRELTKVFNGINQIASYGYDETEKLVHTFKKEDQNVFFFDREEEEACYFNPKLYKMEQFKDKFDDLKQNRASVMEEIDKIFDELNEKLSGVEIRGKAMAVEKQHKVSTDVLRVLKALLRDILPGIEPVSYESITLGQIRKRMGENKEYIISTLENLDKCFELLEETIEDETTILERLSDGLKFVKHIKWIFDIDDYRKHVANLRLKIKEAKQTHKKLREAIILENAEKMLKQIGETRDALRELDKDIKKREEKADEAWSGYVEETKDFIEDVNSFLALLRKKKYKILYKPIEKGLTSLEENISVKDVRELSFKLSELEEIKEEARKSFYKAIEPVLSEKDVKILQLIMNKTKVEGRAWLSNTELRQITKKDLQIEPKELDQFLQKLIKKGLLKPGISLSF